MIIIIIITIRGTPGRVAGRRAPVDSTCVRMCVYIYICMYMYMYIYIYIYILPQKATR